MLAIAATADPPLTWLCIESAAIADVDYSAGQLLLEVHSELQERGVKLDLYGVTALVGEDAYYETVEAALAAHTGARG